MCFVDKSLKFRKDFRKFILGWFAPKVIALEDARFEHNITFKKHWPDNGPVNVYELIHEDYDEKRRDSSDPKTIEEKNFIVFIDPELDVDWIYRGSFESQASKCVSLADSIGAKRCHHLPREQILEFKRIVGQAIVNGISKNYEEASKMADEAAQFLKDRTVERSRIWTLESAHVIFIFFVGIALILLKLPYIQNLLSATPLEIWFATVGGILGAYLSVIQKAGSGEWDAASGRWIHILEVVTKLAAGAFFGGIAFAISRSVYAPSSAKALTPDNYSIFLFGLAAGLFEWLIPKMISSYSEKLQKEN